MIRSHSNIRTGPVGTVGAVLLVTLGVTSGAAAADAQGAASVPGAPIVADARMHEDIYRDYNRSALELKPLYQIESWLGYLRLHPDTPYRDTVRWKLRYLAAALTEEESILLLAMLALEGLPDQLNALTDTTLQQQAVAEFLLIHPSITQSAPHLARLENMLRRIQVTDPAKFVAEKTNRQWPVTEPAVAAVTEPGKAPAELAGTPADAGTQGSSSTGSSATGSAITGSAVGITQPGVEGKTPDEPKAPEVVAAQLPDPPGHPTASTQTGGVIPGVSLVPPVAPEKPETFAASGVQTTPGTGTTAVASIPKVEPRAPEPGPTGLVRLYRWKDGTKGMSAEARQQLWATYLLLYPDGSEAPEALQELRAASQALEAERNEKALRDEALTAELAKSQAYQDEVVQLKEKMAFRKTLMVIGSILLGLVLVTGL